jgi:hypothetical protein
MKTLFKILLFSGIVSIFTASCYNMFREEQADSTISAKLTIQEIKEVFRQKVLDYEITKTRRQAQISKTFFPENYTPQWDKVVSAENEHIWSMDVPILTDKRLMIARKEYNDTIYTPVPQKLVIIKNKETGRKYMYILTLIPDKECGSRFKNKIETTYTHVGDIGNFTGIAVYSTWDGKMINIRRYSKNGSIQLNFKDTALSKSEKHKKITLITAIAGELVLMGGGDPWYLGEIEGAEVTWCQECGQRIDLCTCWDIEYCSTCGYSICRCDEYNDDNSNNGDACPNCGRLNCDGSCESGNNGGGEENGGQTEPPPQNNNQLNIPPDMFTSKDDIKTIVLKVWDLFKNYPDSVSIIARNLIKTYIESNKFVFIADTSIIVAENQILTNPFKVQISYNTTVFSISSEFALSIVFLHELYHIHYTVTNFNTPGLLSDDVQHWHMANEAGYEDWLRQAFPGKSDDFYEALRYTGTGDCFNDLPAAEQDKIRKYGIKMELYTKL